MKKFVSNAEISNNEGSNAEIWQNIFENKEWGKYPSETLIRFIARNFYNVSDRKAINILELGLGTGTNLWFCAREGFTVSGIEWSKAGVDRFLKRMDNEGLKDRIKDIKIGDYYTMLDEFEDESFDAIIDVASLCCNDFEKTRAIFLKSLTKLKKGGKFYSSHIAKGILGFDESLGEYYEPKEGIYQHVGKLRFEDEQSIAMLFKADDFSFSLSKTTLQKDGVLLDSLLIVEGSKA